MDNNAVAHQSGFVGAVYFSFRNIGSGHGAHFGNLIDFAHFHLSGEHLFGHLVEHALHGRLHILDGIVDHRVGVDFHSLLVGLLAGGGRRPYLEAHDNGIGSIGQGDIAFGNLSHSLVDDIHLDLLCR